MWIFVGWRAQIVKNHIVYNFLFFPFNSLTLTKITLIDLAILSVYFTVTFLVFFISSIKYMWILSFILGVGFFIAQLFYSVAFVSVWCFFAGLGSLFIYYIITQYNKTAN